MRARKLTALAAVPILLAGTAGVATADNLENDVVNSTAAGKVLTITGGDPAGATVKYWIHETSAGGGAFQNCDAADGSPVTVTVNAPAGVTATPSSLQFTSCGSASVNTQSVKFTSSAPNSTGYTIGHTTTDSSGRYTNNANFTLKVDEPPAPADSSGPVIAPVLNPADPDGDAGWYKGDVSLTWSVTDPESTISSTTGCVNQNITSDQAETTYSCSATSAGGSTGPVSVTVKRDGTPPVVGHTGASGTLGANGWYTGPVTATFTGTDVLSGPASTTKTVVSTTEGGAVTLSSPAFTDAAGNTTLAGAVKAGPFKIDSQAPNAPEVNVNPAPNGAGWNKNNVTVSFVPDGDNGASGVDTCTAHETVTAETASQTVEGTCTDNAGNVSAVAQVTIKLDKTGPVVSQIVTVDRPADHGDWYTAPVDVTFTATDIMSGLDPAGASATVTSSGEGDPVTVNSPAFTDRADNTTLAGAVSKDLKIDLTNPTVGFSGGPAHGQTYPSGQVPAAPTCTGSDAVSGIATCTVTGYGTSVGTHTMTVTATDNAGRTASASRTYTVTYRLEGFFSPVDPSGTLNKMKGGQTVPLKFRVWDGDQQMTDTSLVRFATKLVSCGSSPTDLVEEFATTGGTSLRYDASGAGQFVQNWKTPTTVGCYAVAITVNGGDRIIPAQFQITK